MKKIGLLVILVIVLVGIIFAVRKPADTRPVVATPPSAAENIRVSRPAANSAIASPLIIEGEARGTWFFEASFPVVLVDWDGKIIAEGHAEAQGDWMTEDFVLFRAELTFTKPAYGERGALILIKDNPSGLPEHDMSLEIPVRFK